MQTKLIRVWLPLSLFLLALPACGLLQPGQRLLHIEIEQEGDSVFSGIRGVPDSTPVKRMWDVLDDVRFEAAAYVLPGTVDSDTDSLTLSGKVVVQIKHVNTVLAETSVSELKLVRSVGTSTWTLAAGEGQRIRQQVNGQ